MEIEKRKEKNMRKTEERKKLRVPSINCGVEGRRRKGKGRRKRR